MKSFFYKRCGMILFLIMPLFNLNAQSLLKMTEITTGGKVFEILPVLEEKGNTTLLKKYPNIDINSSIKVEVNKDKLRQEACNWMSVKTNLPIMQIKSISDFLTNRLALINDIRFKSDDLAEKLKALQNFSSQTAPIFVILSELDRSNPLRIKTNKILSEGNKDASVTYNKIFDLLQEEINAIGGEYKSVLENNKIFFRLGTFVNNMPVHLEGFDSYKEGDYYFVPPFVTNIPEDQKQEFEKYREIADKANNDALKVLTEKLQFVTNPLLDSLQQVLKVKFNGSISTFEKAVDSLEKITDAVNTEITQNKENITKFSASIDLLIAYSKDVKRPDYVKNIAESILQAYNDYSDLDQSLKNSLSKLEKGGTSEKFKNAYINLKTSYTLGLNVVKENINAVKAFYDSKNLLQINLTQKTAESLLKLGEEVSNLPLDNIPNQSVLDLTRTVVRKNGDRLTFKAVLTRPSPEKDMQEEKTIDYTSIGLYQIGLHNSILAVLILADNLSGQFPSKKQFQFDPSYSVLFKTGSRKSSFYNDFVEFGFGINMATLDFNNDDNPEVGIGLVFSAFKDYLQIGYGRNFGLDQNYWFFGIRLPFLGMNLDGKPKLIPVNQ